MKANLTIGRSGIIALLVVISALSVGIGRVSANHDVEPGQIFEWRRGEADPAPTTPAE